MADLLFSGGPCSGKHETIPDDFTATRISCGGTTYRIYQVEPGYWLGLLPSATPPQTTVAPVARKAGPAWRRLVHGLVSQVPADVRRSARARQHLLRIARR